MSSRRAGPSCAVLALFQVAVVCLLSSGPICSHLALAQVRKTVSSQKPGEQDVDPDDVTLAKLALGPSIGVVAVMRHEVV